MYIRLMQLEDYEAVLPLWQTSPGMGLNDIDDSRSGIAKFLTRNPHTCFVAVEGSAVVAAVIAGHDGRRGFIYHLAVAHPHRRRGIGSALLAALWQAFADEGIAKAALVVFARNADGNAFWEHHGFTERKDLIYRNKALRKMIRTDT